MSFVFLTAILSIVLLCCAAGLSFYYSWVKRKRDMSLLGIMFGLLAVQCLRLVLTGDSAQAKDVNSAMVSAAAALLAPFVAWRLALRLPERVSPDRKLRSEDSSSSPKVDSNSPCLIWLDNQDRIERISPDSNMPLGVAPSDRMVGTPFDRLFLPNLASKLRALLDLARSGKLGTLEIEVALPDSTLKTIELCVAPIETGRRSGRVLCMIRDLTELRCAEGLLRQRESLLQVFIDAAPIALAMFDRDMRYLAVSRRWMKDYGQNHQTLIGLSHYDVFPNLPQRWLDVHQRCLQGRAEISEEDSFVRADGSIQWMRWQVHPWLKDNEEVGGLVLFSEDITARKQSEMALRDKEEQLRLAVEAAQVGTYDRDFRTGRISSSPIHDCLWGFEPGQYDGSAETLLRRLHPEDAVRLEGEILRSTTSKEPCVCDLRVIWPDGSQHWMHNRGEITADEMSRPLRMRGGVIEITQEKDAEEELARSHERMVALSKQLLASQEAERRNLARELHDEIGQILTAVNLNLQQALAECESAVRPRLNEGVTIVEKAIEQVRGMSLNLRPAVLDDFGLVPALRWLVEKANESGEIIIALDASVFSTFISREISTACFRLAQEALTNIQRHAKARRAWINLNEFEGALHLSIRDDGVGCSSELAQKSSSVGQSLGLLSMRERVELLGGEFSFQSEPKMGTHVRAIIPLRGNTSFPEKSTVVRSSSRAPSVGEVL